MTPIIEIVGLTHVFGNGMVGLNDINLSFQRGSFTVIAGCNGTGKTTLLRHLNGLLLPTEGEVRIDGVTVADDLVGARQKVGMVFQDSDAQIVGETVYEDAAFGPENLRLQRNEIDRRVRESLKAVGLEQRAEERPHLLSGGQKRLLTIAGILAMESPVLVFDEPFSNLDYPGTRKVLENIVNLHRTGHTIILTTHDLEKVIAHADRLIVMAGGRVERDGRPELLLGDLERFGVRPPCATRLGHELESWLG